MNLRPEVNQVMKPRLLVAWCAALGLVTATSPGIAGDFHAGVNLVCADCHVMHFSQTHGYDPSGTGSFTPIGGAAPHHALLRNDVNDLCLSCHDAQAFAPDVFEASSNGYVRQAGGLNHVGGNGLYPPATGHTLGATEVAPGGTWANADGLSCANCHAVHGSNSAGVSSYRNLGGHGTAPGSTFAISYSSGATNDLTRWVYENQSSGVSDQHYGQIAIIFNEPDQSKSKYGEFCKACHTNFHGDIGGAEIGGTGTPPAEFVRHPALGSNIGAIGGGHSNLTRFAGKTNQVQVMSPTGVRAGSYTTANTDLTPSCMSCHKGHGNQNAFGLIYMLGTGTMTEEGDSGVDARNMCRQCHGQGGAGTAF
jgi:hypothetical protein